MEASLSPALILVTGAAGKTGQSIIKSLVRCGLPVRALVRGAHQVELVKSLGARDIVSGDLESPEDYRRAAAGVKAIYHICPNVHPREKEIGRIAIEAARKMGVPRFVYHSVLHPQSEKMPHHWQKLRVEEMLFESALNFTILQPAVYMQNILGSRESLFKEGVYPVPYPLGTRLSLVDLEDVAEVAANILKDSGHDRAIYELSGREAPTQTEVASAITRIIGRPVRAKQLPIDSWRRAAGVSDPGEYRIETLVAMFKYYASYGLQGNGNLLTWLLGRPPTSLDTFLTRELRNTGGI